MNSTNLNGVYAEAQFTIYAMESGWEIAEPLMAAVPYDRLIRRSPESPWETVQVKHAFYTTDGVSGHRYLTASVLRGGRSNSQGGKKHRKYKDGDFDWLFIFHEEGKWFLPWDLVKKLRSQIRVGSPRYDLWKV